MLLNINKKLLMIIKFDVIEYIKKTSNSQAIQSNNILKEPK